MPFPSASAADENSTEQLANERDSTLQRESATTCRLASARAATWMVTNRQMLPALLSLCVLLGAHDVSMCKPPPPNQPPSEWLQACRCCGARRSVCRFGDKQFFWATARLVPEFKTKRQDKEGGGLVSLHCSRGKVLKRNTFCTSKEP